MLDAITTYAPVISLVTPVLLVAVVGGLSRWFVPREQYENDRAEMEDRLDVLTEEQSLHAEQLRKKPDASTVGELVASMRQLESTVAVQGEKISAIQDSVSRIDKQTQRITDTLMARQ